MNWLLPDNIADVLPLEAARLELLRGLLLAVAGRFGYEQVIPPLIEYPESLLSGTGRDLSEKTFRFIDPQSGRMLGLRADITPQVARMDAHLLNRQAETRLCYCASSVHARAEGVYASREPLQFGAELFGVAALHADLEVQELAVAALQAAEVNDLLIDLSHARLIAHLLSAAGLREGSAQAGEEFHLTVLDAIAAKDPVALRSALEQQPESRLAQGHQQAFTQDAQQLKQAQQALIALLDLYGDAKVLTEARRALPAWKPLQDVLTELEQAASTHAHQGRRVHIDLAGLRGYRYHNGLTFALFARRADGGVNPVARGGRYDGVGAHFGRARPATGFSLDLRELGMLSPTWVSRRAILAPWGSTDASLNQALEARVAELRAQGETVVRGGQALLAEQPERFDRQFRHDAKQGWVLEALTPSQDAGAGASSFSNSPNSASR